MLGLGKLPGGRFYYSIAEATSADGSVVVGWSKTGLWTHEAYRWTADGGMQGLGHFDGGGATSSASSVSADGSVVVSVSKTALGNQAFRWTPEGGLESLGHDDFGPRENAAAESPSQRRFPSG